ncbi:MAG: crossover junction endodeoxyribonuclease RuvC [Desulfovibrionaceae bacterium]|jgi:crossover junction endodeoxyribonuclease RuvC|nr:crossover junction endodeoxyribonuclease RuvC [Desulfovibrionaceae bacterium]
MAAAITVIGIDPGSQNTGWGVVQEVSGVLSLVECGVIRTGSAGGAVFSERLACIYRELSTVLARLNPQEAAVEQVFTAHNAATALKLGQARGVAVAACAAQGISISDYEPTLVKKTIVGTGRAEKEQVRYMVARLLQVKNPQWALDTSDALAIALCHLTLRRYAQWGKQK